MDLLFILRDALGSSAIGTLVAAVDAKQAGRSVGVLITQEALAALAGASFDWPRALSNPPMRIQLAKGGKELGLPVYARGAGKKLDPMATFAWAREQGIVLYACPLWSALLGISQALPAGLEKIGREAATHLISDAKQVVGSL